MLENEFFPTPQAVIDKMIAPFIEMPDENETRFMKPWLNFKGNTILDPEGGKGDILEYLSDKYKISKSCMFAIEIDPDLRYILQDKGYRIIGINFLEYDEPCKFDLILMNPPFSTGVKHVLKGWEVLEDDGDLVSLLNSQTLKNPCSKEREYLLHLLATMIGRSYTVGEDSLDDLLAELEAEGFVEWLGQCFRDAERTTDIDIALIRLHKPAKSTSNLFEAMNFEFDNDVFSEGFSPNTLAHRDAIADLVARYNAARNVLVERHEAQFKLNFYLNGISKPVSESTEYDSKKKLINNDLINEEILLLKSCFWNTVFQQTELGIRIPSRFQTKFHKFALEQSSLTFTEDNIRDVLMAFVENINQVMMDTLVEVFDKATEYHQDNKAGKGWVTNKSYKLNNKIIIPNGVYYSKDFNDFSLYCSNESFLDDLDKVLCWLSGIKFSRSLQTTKTSIERFCRTLSESEDYRQKFDSVFFNIKIFKVGTVHLHFKDLKLLEEFNLKAAQGKKWIGSEKPLS